MDSRASTSPSITPAAASSMKPLTSLRPCSPPRRTTALPPCLPTRARPCSSNLTTPNRASKPFQMLPHFHLHTSFPAVSRNCRFSKPLSRPGRVTLAPHSIWGIFSTIGDAMPKPSPNGSVRLRLIPISPSHTAISASPTSTSIRTPLDPSLHSIALSQPIPPTRGCSLSAISFGSGPASRPPLVSPSSFVTLA